jgi:hypothetical protein
MRWNEFQMFCALLEAFPDGWSDSVMTVLLKVAIEK